MKRVLTALTALCVVGIALGGCTRLPSIPGSSAPTAADTTPAPAITTPPPAEEEGTRERPFPLNYVVTITENGADTWELAVNSPTFAANQIVADENQFNDVPPAGFEWVLLPVSVVYLGADARTPWLDFDAAFVTAGGQTYESEYAVIPNDFRDIADLYAGGSGAGNFGLMLPTAELAGGTWRITAGYDLHAFFVVQ